MSKYEGMEVVAVNSVNYPVNMEVYDFEYGIDDKVIARFGIVKFSDSNVAMQNRKPRAYKLYEDNDGRVYAKWQGQKFYMDETIRLNLGYTVKNQQN